MEQAGKERDRERERGAKGREGSGVATAATLATFDLEAAVSLLSCLDILRRRSKKERKTHLLRSSAAGVAVSVGGCHLNAYIHDMTRQCVGGRGGGCKKMKPKRFSQLHTH